MFKKKSLKPACATEVVCTVLQFVWWIQYTFTATVSIWPVVCFNSVLHLAQREDEVFYDVVAIVDPLTREAQKLAPLLVVCTALVILKNA